MIKLLPGCLEHLQWKEYPGEMMCLILHGNPTEKLEHSNQATILLWIRMDGFLPVQITVGMKHKHTQIQTVCMKSKVVLRCSFIQYK